MQMNEEGLMFENDGLYRITPVYGYVNLVHKDLVMNKDVFIACYKKWILEEEEKNNVSVDIKP